MNMATSASPSRDFFNKLKNAIANVTLGQGPGVSGVGFVAAGGAYRQRENVDAVKVHGVEASASWARGPWLGQAGMAGLTREWKRAGSGFPRRITAGATPNFAATLSFGYDQDGKGAQIVLRRMSAQFEDDLNTRTLKAATTVDAFVPGRSRNDFRSSRGGKTSPTSWSWRGSTATVRSTRNTADALDRSQVALIAYAPFEFVSITVSGCATAALRERVWGHDDRCARRQHRTDVAAKLIGNV